MSESARNGQPGVTTAASGARFHLAIFDDHLRSLPLPDGTLLIGRSQKSDLPIHDHLLSRKHCALTVQGDCLVLADLHSSNGTYLNGVAVTSSPLKLDDIIEVGQTVMVVFDGRSWERGMGLVSLRNPIKAQELVQRIRDAGGRSLESCFVRAPVPAALRNESAELDRWIDSFQRQERDNHLPGMLADAALQRLVEDWLRKSKRMEELFDSVLDEVLKPGFCERCGSVAELRAALEVLFRRRLAEPSRNGSAETPAGKPAKPAEETKSAR